MVLPGWTTISHGQWSVPCPEWRTDLLDRCPSDSLTKWPPVLSGRPEHELPRGSSKPRSGSQKNTYTANSADKFHTNTYTYRPYYMTIMAWLHTCIMNAGINITITVLLALLLHYYPYVITLSRWWLWTQCIIIIIIIIIIDNRGLNARWCLTPFLLSLPTAAYLGSAPLQKCIPSHYLHSILIFFFWLQSK